MSTKNSADSNLIKKTVTFKPRQEALKNEILNLQAQLESIQKTIDSGISCIENPLNLIKNIRKELDYKKKSLEITKNRAICQAKFRIKHKKFLIDTVKKNPEAVKNHKIHVTEESRRPRLEIDQPGLLEAIASIAMFGASASEKRRSETLHSCKTLDDLFKELEKLGFECCKTSAYYRLLPRNAKSIEGKRHQHGSSKIMPCTI